MRLKVSVWGNSQAIRLSAPLLEHLQASAGDELEVRYTENGLEIMKAVPNEEYIRRQVTQAIESMTSASAEVSPVSDPYSETDVDYIVIALNPCHPLIREVPKGTRGAYTTLIQAKEAARQVIQVSLRDAQESLARLRQLGVDNIAYIAL